MGKNELRGYIVRCTGLILVWPVEKELGIKRVGLVVSLLVGFMDNPKDLKGNKGKGKGLVSIIYSLALYVLGILGWLYSFLFICVFG